MPPAWRILTPREIKFRAKWKPEPWKGIQPGVQFCSHGAVCGRRKKSCSFKKLYTSLSNWSPENFSSSTILAIWSSPSVRGKSVISFKKKKKVLSFPRNWGRQVLCNFGKLNLTSPFLIRHKPFQTSSPTVPSFPFLLFFLPSALNSHREIHHFIYHKNVVEDVSSTTHDSISKDIDYIPPWTVLEIAKFMVSFKRGVQPSWPAFWELNSFLNPSYFLAVVFFFALFFNFDLFYLTKMCAL